jgi:hypothetical protein
MGFRWSDTERHSQMRVGDPEPSILTMAEARRPRLLASPADTFSHYFSGIRDHPSSGSAGA